MSGLLRYQIFLSYGILIFGIWYTLIQNKSSILHHANTVSSNLENNDTAFSFIQSMSITIFSSLPRYCQEPFIDYFPLWIVICLGLYAVGSIVYGVTNFVDCPGAAMEVEKHVKEAKTEMKKRGVIE